MRSTALSVAFVIGAILCFVIAALYALGVLQIFVSDPHAAHHYTHTILFVVLGVASLIAANFTRPKTV